MAASNLIHFKPGTGLARYDAMCTAIAECQEYLENINEDEDFPDKLKALEFYAKIAKNLELEKHVADVRIRAEREVRQFLGAWQLARRLAMKFQLGSGWNIQCDLIRGTHQEYAADSPHWPDPISYLIDQERRARFLIADPQSATRRSEYFLTLSYDSTLRVRKKAANWVFSSEDGKASGPGEDALALFQKKIAEIENLLRSTLLAVARLRGHRTVVGQNEQFCDRGLQFIRRCVTGEDYPFSVPDCPMYLNQYLATDDFTGGAEPLLGNRHIRVVAIDGFPERSFAGILRELDSIPYDFRYCQQAAVLDEQEAKEEHGANRSKWGFKKDPKQYNPIKNAVRRIDPFAAQMEADAALAESAAEHGKEIFVRFSAKVVLMETDSDRLRLALDAVIRTVKYRCGFSCRIETVNAVAAWLATLPGHHYKERRTFVVNTENMVHMMPLSAPFRGHHTNPSPYFPKNSPPLFYAVTSGGTPYRFHPYVQDVGHTVITGPNGSGKTTLLGLGVAQFFRYPGAQVFAFDKKRTLYTLTKAMGGDYYDISPDSESISLCPLQHLSSASDREWAAQWLELLLVQNDLKVTARMRNEIATALEELAGDPHSGRSLTDFRMAVSSVEVKEAIETYLGSILDGDSDTLSMSRFCVFEMDELYRLDKKLMNGALFYIFHRIRKRLRADIPTLVTVDEFREALSHPMAAKAFEEFLFEGRKLNCAVWLVLQELSKMLASPLKGAVLEQCFTKICLANPQAIAEGASAYEVLGLNAVDRHLIAQAQPKSDYYVTSPDGKRMISLELQELALSFLAASTDRDRTAVDGLIARNPNSWQADWLRSRGLIQWADYLDSLLPSEEVRYAFA